MLSTSSIYLVGLIIICCFGYVYYKKFNKKRETLVYQDRNFDNFINALQKQIKQEEIEEEES